MRVRPNELTEHEQRFLECGLFRKLAWSTARTLTATYQVETWILATLDMAKTTCQWISCDVAAGFIP